jgi:hypothetical protein
MLRRVFTAASATSLLGCILFAYLAFANYALWVQGYVTSETSPVFHDRSNFEASRHCEWLAIASAVLPLAWASLHIRDALRLRVSQERLLAGRCPDCGYDLRASATTCPECGRPITTGGAKEGGRKTG